MYRVRQADVHQDREVILGLLRRNLAGSERWDDKLRWFYLDSPFGRPLVSLLEHRGRPVGIAAAGPRVLEYSGEALRAGVLADMAVAPEHRALGPALMLQRSLVAEAEGRFDLLYGFPNRKAAPVFKRCGHAHLSDVVRYVRVLRFDRYIRRHAPEFAAKPIACLLNAVTRGRVVLRRSLGRQLHADWTPVTDSDLDRLWDASDRGASVLSRRTSQFIRWRIEQFPGESGRLLHVRHADSGNLLAWFACQTQEDTLNVIDFWSVDGVQGIDLRYVEALSDAAYVGGHTGITVSLSAGGTMASDWVSAGFRPRGRRPIFGVWLRSPPQSVAARNIYLTAADEDE